MPKFTALAVSRAARCANAAVFSHPINPGFYLQDDQDSSLASTSNKPTIILCSGAWHTEAHIRPVTPHFEKAG